MQRENLKTAQSASNRPEQPDCSDQFFWSEVKRVGRQNFPELRDLLQSYVAWQAIPSAQRERVLTLAVDASRQEWSAFDRKLRAKFCQHERYPGLVHALADAERKTRDLEGEIRDLKEGGK